MPDTVPLERTEVPRGIHPASVLQGPSDPGGRSTDLLPAYVGGAITGGVADLTQLFTRPVARLDPYATPDPALFLCSHATPPGGGVHGMCGYHAAQSVLRRLARRS